jgi:hypothetical protein
MGTHNVRSEAAASADRDGYAAMVKYAKQWPDRVAAARFGVPACAIMILESSPAVIP